MSAPRELELQWLKEAMREHLDNRALWREQCRYGIPVTPYEPPITEGELARMLELSRFDWTRGAK